MIYPQARFHNHVSNFQGILIWIRHHDQFQISDISFGISSIPLILMDPFFQSIWCHGATITLRSSFMQALSIYCLSLRISPMKHLGIQPARKNGRTKQQPKWRGSTKNLQWFNMINHGFTKRGDPGDPKRHEIAISPCQLPARTQAWRGIAAAPPPPSWRGYRVSCGSRPRRTVICGG